MIPFRSIAALCVAMLFLWSCENDPGEVHKLTPDQDIPLEVQENFKLVYTDSSFKRMELMAPLAERYPQVEEPYLEFRRGIRVRFFNASGEEESRLRADYAIQFIEKHLWRAEGDVEVYNSNTKETLNTEELFWDERKEIIYSDKFVKITTEEEIIMGEGFKADQNFSRYELNKVTGTIILDEDE